MSIIEMREITIAYGGPALLEGASLRIERLDRVFLLGRNGAGKTTLLKLLAGEIEPDAGELIAPQQLRVSRLAQETPTGISGSVYRVVEGGLRALSVATRSEPEVVDGWQHGYRVEALLSRLRLDPEADFAALSGGTRRQVLLARALVAEPDLLLLDEPTNHLDIDAVIRLESLLDAFRGAIVLVSHDREFVRRLATRVVEIAQGRLTDWRCDYETYILRRDSSLTAERARESEMDKRLAAEESWVRQGIKARRTRNEGRVRALLAMREERRTRRRQLAKLRLGPRSVELSGKLVAQAEHVSFGFDGDLSLRDFSCTILRGDKVGIIGPNGVGKTTLLRLLLGELTPSSGCVRRGTNLSVAYFDQLRERLEEEQSVCEAVAGGSDHVVVDGKRKHVLGYLREFLFEPERARTPVRALSGGERSRLLLARLFTRSFNVLVMDEPTNDLDMETLDLLEDVLVAFTGTLLLVSHDRTLLNNVVTSTLVFDAPGCLREYVGGYDDWVRQSTPTSSETSSTSRNSHKAAREPLAAQRTDTRGAKLSYKEKIELDALPASIEALEHEQGTLQQQLCDPVFYRDNNDVARVQGRLKAVEEELDRCYRRWETLEERPR